MGLGPARLDEAIEASLNEWRRKATDALALVGALVYLPGLALWLAGHGPPVPWTVTALAFTSYLTVAAATLLRRVDHRARVWAVLGPGYLLSLLAGISFPQGPFLRSLPITLSILALVLIGARAGRTATLVSVAILLLGPLLRAVPGMARPLVVDPIPAPSSPALLLTQGFALAAALVALMILLERFYMLLLQSLAAQRGVAAVLVNEMQERRRLEREIARIGDEERCRMGQDVHDGVCQQITGALLRCQALERELTRGNSLSLDNVTALSGLLEDAIDEAHTVAQGLCPLGEEPGALASALRTLANRTRKSAGVRCEFVALGEVRVADPAAAHNLYRIAQEAVSNAVRHAQAGRIVVELFGREDDIVLRVEDDGAGLPAELPDGGMGLSTMTYRAQAMDGTLTVEPAPEGGTRVTCRVPLGGPARPGDLAGIAAKEGHDGA